MTMSTVIGTMAMVTLSLANVVVKLHFMPCLGIHAHASGVEMT